MPSATPPRGPDVERSSHLRLLRQLGTTTVESDQFSLTFTERQRLEAALAEMGAVISYAGYDYINGVADLGYTDEDGRRWNVTLRMLPQER